MKPEDIKRLCYYERQFLGVSDFQAEQSYHMDMRRRHLIAQHTWGIIVGLELSQPLGADGWSLQPGMAVDGFGREIVVFENRPFKYGPDCDPIGRDGGSDLVKYLVNLLVGKRGSSTRRL